MTECKKWNHLLGIDPDTNKPYMVTKFCEKFNIPRQTLYFFLQKKLLSPKKIKKNADMIYTKSGVNLYSHYQDICNEHIKVITEISAMQDK
jgi:hypothetical protein